MVIEMDKILTFIVNEYNEILLLKENPRDPQFNESFWYVVTGGYEKQDNNLENTVKREVLEETGLIVNKSKFLNLIFKYKSLGKECIEYVYISFVNKNKVILNEESIDYRWCNLQQFIESVKWYGKKEEFKNILIEALKGKMYLKKEKIEEIK